jgi:hypothetical protein
MEATMREVWAVSPPNEEIKKDILELPEVLGRILEAEGCYISDTVQRHDYRAVQIWTAQVFVKGKSVGTRGRTISSRRNRSLPWLNERRRS